MKNIILITLFFIACRNRGNRVEVKWDSAVALEQGLMVTGDTVYATWLAYDSFRITETKPFSDTFYIYDTAHRAHKTIDSLKKVIDSLTVKHGKSSSEATDRIDTGTSRFFTISTDTFLEDSAFIYDGKDWYYLGAPSSYKYIPYDKPSDPCIGQMYLSKKQPNLK